MFSIVFKIGESLTGSMVTVTVAVSWNSPSVMVYVNESDEASELSWMYSTSLSTIDTLPNVPWVTESIVGVDSESLSLSRTSTSTVPPSATVVVSSSATGGSLTGVMVTSTVAVSVNSPSVMVYVNESDVVSEPSWTY